MRYRQLDAFGLEISDLTMGTMTFGGKDWYAAIGSTDLDEARRQLD
jgi:aryl-alcohol dehydrogenase-like predicted oxidoreductase